MDTTLAPRFENECGRFRGLSVSAGALQAVDVLLVVGGKVFRYDRALRSIQMLRVRDPDRLTRFFSRCQALLPNARGAFAVFVGDLPYISAYYDRPESLIYRDAGALLQTMAFVFTAYRLGFCPMGLLGTEVIEAVGLNPDKAIPLATAAMGRPPAVNFQTASES